MAANPLMIAPAQGARPIPPQDKAARVQFWIDRGNRILWGQEPDRNGEWLSPRHDLEWVHRNGSYSIEPRHRPAVQAIGS